MYDANGLGYAAFTPAPPPVDGNNKGAFSTFTFASAFTFTFRATPAPYGFGYGARFGGALGEVVHVEYGGCRGGEVVVVVVVGPGVVVVVVTAPPPPPPGLGEEVEEGVEEEVEGNL